MATDKIVKSLSRQDSCNFSCFQCFVWRQIIIVSVISLLCFPFLHSIFHFSSFQLSTIQSSSRVLVFRCCLCLASSLSGQLDACGSLTVLRLTSLSPSKSNPLTTAAVSSPTCSPIAAVQHPQRGRWLSKYRTVPLVPATARSRGALRKVYRAIITATLNLPMYTPLAF